MASTHPLTRLLAMPLIAWASCPGCSDTTPPLQVEPVASVAIQPSVATLTVGEADTLVAVVYDAANGVLADRALQWSSSDVTKVTVNHGVVTGVAAGTAIITVVSEGKAATATVTVVASGGGGGGGGSGALTATLSYYLGGTDWDAVRGVAVDAAGNIYLAGGTASPTFPTTPGAFQRVHNPGTPSQPGITPMDAFVMKLSPTGQILWSTLLGGPDYDHALAVEVDAQGNVYVGGDAGAGFPVTPGAFQTAFHGGSDTGFYGPQDGFVCKLNSTGSAPIYCSYFGSSDPRTIRDIAIDGQGNLYLQSSATQDGLPSAWFSNAFQKTRAGGADGVIAKVNATGSQVLWATYLGGTGNDGGGGGSVRVDNSGNVYVVQNTGSSDLPTPGGFDHTGGSAGNVDVYLAKLSSDGSRLLYATYLGGSTLDFGETHNLAVDGAGNAYVGFTTTSTDFATTPGAYQTSFAGMGQSGTGKGTNNNGDAAIVKVSPGGALLAATYLGGRYGEGLEGIELDPQGNVLVSGGTFSPDFPTTVPPLQNRGGDEDAFVAKLDPSLHTLIFSQKVGGSGRDVARCAAVDAAGNMYAGGEVESSDFPTLSPVQGHYGGGTDGLFLKFVLTN